MTTMMLSACRSTTKFSPVISTCMRRSLFVGSATTTNNAWMMMTAAADSANSRGLSATTTTKTTTRLNAAAFVQQRLSFSTDTHSDFAPKRKEVDGVDEAMKMIKEHVEGNPVMLYMKGNPSMPMCGFSATVVQILQSEGVDFSSVNVLDYPDIREGVKKYSEWPTIPQLYVNGEFIGGCDIITQMHKDGELKDLLAEAKEQ